MVYLKMLAPVCTLAVAMIYVAFQERWWRLHDGRRVRHKCAVRVVVALLILSAIASCIVLYSDSLASQALLEQIENCQPPKRMGALKPRYLATPTNISPGITLSSHGVRSDGTRKADQQAIRFNLADGKIAQPFGPNVAFSVRKTQEGLLISAIVYDIDGKIAARVIDNVWRVFDEQYLDRNFDSSAIEVIDTYGVPVLQVEFFAPDTVRVGGVFKGENAAISETDSQFPTLRAGSGGSGHCRISSGSKFVMGEKGQIIGGKWPSTATERDDLVTEAKKLIVPWFDYSKPGRLGVRIGPTDKGNR